MIYLALIAPLIHVLPMTFGGAFIFYATLLCVPPLMPWMQGFIFAGRSNNSNEAENRVTMHQRNYWFSKWCSKSLKAKKNKKQKQEIHKRTLQSWPLQCNKATYVVALTVLANTTLRMYVEYTCITIYCMSWYIYNIYCIMYSCVLYPALMWRDN